MVAPRYFFVHMQKTAGTTLRQRISHMLGEAALYPSDLDGDMVGEFLTFTVPELVRRLPRRPEIEVVFGHFPLCTSELLDGPWRTLTMLRDPVERSLSYLRHHREWSPADQHKRLEEIYDEPIRRHLAVNHMTKMLSMTAEEMSDGMLTDIDVTEARVDAAKAALERIDVVGTQERFDEFVAQLEAQFGWRLGDRPRFANRSHPVDVPASFRRRIEADNWADAALYQHVCTLMGE